MCDVFECPVFAFSAGHRDEKTVGAVDDLDVVNDETLVERHGSDAFQLAVFVFDQADAHICYFHITLPLLSYIIFIVAHNAQDFNRVLKSFCLFAKKVFLCQKLSVRGIK